jgi:hypothetical protein
MTTATTTASEIITDAFGFAGIGDQYNPLDGTTIAGALRSLNDLIDSMSTEEMTIFGYTEGTIALTVGVSPILVGPGQGLGLRPSSVQSVAIVDSGNVTHPVAIIGTQQYADITYKPAPGRPEMLYNDGNAPVANWYLWPLPAMVGDVLHAWYWAQIPQFNAVNNLLVSPPGYSLFLKTALGALLAAMNGRELTPANARIARNARNNARRLSNQPKVLSLDVPMPSAPWFNIYTGGPL